MLVKKRISIIIILIIFAIINFIFLFLFLNSHKSKVPNNNHTEDTNGIIFLQDQNEFTREEEISPQSQENDGSGWEDNTQPSSFEEDVEEEEETDPGSRPVADPGEIQKPEEESPLEPAPYVE